MKMAVASLERISMHTEFATTYNPFDEFVRGIKF